VKKYVAASRDVKRYEKVFRIFSEEQKRYEETPPMPFQKHARAIHASVVLINVHGCSPILSQ